MRLRSDITEILSGFEKRMKFINIMRTLQSYKYPDEIRTMIPDREVLDNVIIAVLVYIKEVTLGIQRNCSMQDISEFIEQISPVLEPYQIHAQKLARYIVVEVLQNSGVLREFNTYNSNEEKFEKMTVRLLNEEKGAYTLTDDTLDFLFRSKEIESELEYSVARFRMNEFLKRDNYNEALDNSRELVSRIRQLKLNINDFINRCREDISRITVDGYETIIGDIRKLLEEEDRELQNIQKLARKKLKIMQETMDPQLDNSKLKESWKALNEVIRNIEVTMDEQRILINKRSEFSRTYESLLMENFSISPLERMNFDKEIMQPLRKKEGLLEDAASFLLFMLSKPDLEKRFSVENFYMPQSRITENQEEPGLDISMEETETEKQVEIQNERHRSLIHQFFTYASQHSQFVISDFILSLTVQQMSFYCEENTLPNDLLTLYSMQQLDLEQWRNSEKFTTVPNGEFDCSWCLEEIPQELLQMNKVIFSHSSDIFDFDLTKGDRKIKISMTDFSVEVVR